MNLCLKRLSDYHKEQRSIEFIRCSVTVAPIYNTTTIVLTKIAALEATMSDLNTRISINLHLIGANMR